MNDIKIQGGGITPISLRKAQQKLSLISRDQVLRTVNGNLVTLGNPWKKYQMEIWGEGLNIPELGRLAKGQEVSVDSAQRFFQSISESPIILEHAALPTSILVMGTKKECMPFEMIDTKTIRVEDTLINSNFIISYLPIFHMKIMDLSYETSLDGFESKWCLILAEI